MVSLALLFASCEQRKARDLIAYAIALIIAFLIFCSYLKWNPWNSRLQLPLFVLWSPLISLVVFRRAGYKVALSIVLLLMTASTLYVFRNEIRPLIGVGPNSTVLNTSRIERLLKRHPVARAHYPGAAHFVKTLHCSEVGLLIGHDYLEYPFWVLLKKSSDQPPIHIQHIYVRNVSRVKSTVNPFAGFSPCAVIVVDVIQEWQLAEVGNDTQVWASSEGKMFTEVWSSGPVHVFIKKEGI
jgi:hypothetical protein